MTQLIVTVDKLNKRTAPVTDFGKKANVAGIVFKGYRFQGTLVTQPVLPDKWYRDSDGYYYWGGGLTVLPPDEPVTATQATQPAQPPTPQTQPAGGLKFTIRQDGRQYFGTADGGKEFYIGSETHYLGLDGLFNTRVADGPTYDPTLYEKDHGFWAWFVYPTGMCESKLSYHCLNTYDRAAFTFTFMQFAAHVPNGDFVKFMRALLGLQEAKQYFPQLELRNGFIFDISGAQPVQLETNTDTSKLMHYLNSSSTQVDQNELNAAARFVHWAQNSDGHRALQATSAANLFYNNMKSYAQQYNLNGMPDYICHTVCDIRHQGRATSAQIRDALSSSSDMKTMYQNLSGLGEEHYAERVSTLRSTHQQLIQKGIFGTHTYDTAKGDFVVIS